MKLHHAAALALVGWYLMVPPAFSTSPEPNAEIHINLGAPLSQWDNRGSYDSAEECMHMLAFSQKTTQADVAAGRVEGGKDGAKALLAQVMQGQCIASDDPR